MPELTVVKSVSDKTAKTLSFEISLAVVPNRSNCFVSCHLTGCLGLLGFKIFCLFLVFCSSIFRIFVASYQYVQYFRLFHYTCLFFYRFSNHADKLK